MVNKKYIKVTVRGSKTPVVVLGSLEDYYRSQGAKIDVPTDDEVNSAFPEEGKRKLVLSAIEQLEREKKQLIEERDKLRERVAELEAKKRSKKVE